MKIAFIVFNDIYIPRVMELLSNAGIDYYTLWEQVKGKGHDTDAHLGTRSFPGMNAVVMIAFEDESELEKLIPEIVEANKGITRPDNRVRLFQLPLERVV